MSEHNITLYQPLMDIYNTVINRNTCIIYNMQKRSKKTKSNKNKGGNLWEGVKRVFIFIFFFGRSSVRLAPFRNAGLYSRTFILYNVSHAHLYNICIYATGRVRKFANTLYYYNIYPFYAHAHIIEIAYNNMHLRHI